MVLLALFTRVSLAEAQSREYRLRINPADGKHAVFSAGTRPDTVEAGDEVRVAPGDTMQILVTGQNNAFYTCSVTSEPLIVPEITALNQFGSAFGPYLAEGVESISFASDNKNRFGFITPPDARDRGMDAKSLELAAEALEAASLLAARLQHLDSLLYEERGLRTSRVQVLTTLEAMARTPTVDRTLLDALRARIPVTCTPTCSFTLVDTLAADLNALPSLVQQWRTARIRAGEALMRYYDLSGAERRQSLRGAPAALEARLNSVRVPEPAVLDSLEARGNKALEDAGGLLTAAHSVKVLAERAANATDEWVCDSVTVKGTKGKTVTVTIKPRAEPELARLARHQPVAFKAEVQPERGIRLRTGVSLLYAPQARFSTYVGKDVEGGVQVVKSSTQDSRATFGLNIGAAFPRLEDAIGFGSDKVTLWLGELTINPLADERAIGLGSGLELFGVKVGGGVLWTRHKALDGQSVGAVVESVRTRDRYSSSPYISFAIVGLPPFAVKE